MLRLLECYTLRAIGHLEAKDDAAMVSITPKLQSIYKADGAWHEVIAKVMELPPNMPELIRGMWQKNQEIARQNQTSLPPQSFAEMFVDANLT